MPHTFPVHRFTREDRIERLGAPLGVGGRSHLVHRRMGRGAWGLRPARHTALTRLLLQRWRPR